MKKFPDDLTIRQGFFSSEDSTCSVDCECGESTLWVSDHEITRCPRCGKGYRTEFIVWQFEPDEKAED